jgi:hypothetical protein
MQERILKFVLRTDKILHLTERFHPEGRIVLNSTEWRGKEPRSCGVTNVRSHTYTGRDKGPIPVDVEVTYRPKGCITFVGDTKYDGWTAMMLDRQPDGTLLDGKGQPLPDGAPPVYLGFQMYKEMDFNEIDFGEFVGESEKPSIPHLALKDVLEQVEQHGMSKGSIHSSFMAPRRSRPSVKIILTNEPSGTGRDGFGTHIINIDNATPQLEQVLLDKLSEVMDGFLEGRFSLKNIGTDDMTFVELSDALVDCTPNEHGLDSWFGVLSTYVPSTFMEELAKRIMAKYLVNVSIVDGKDGGLLLRHESEK